MEVLKMNKIDIYLPRTLLIEINLCPEDFPLSKNKIYHLHSTKGRTGYVYKLSGFEYDENNFSYWIKFQMALLIQDRRFHLFKEHCHAC